MRATISLLILLATATVAQAGQFPEIPESERVLSQQEVKNYWANRMPQPDEPSRLDRGYQSLIIHYHQQVGERHRLIKAIRAGKHDRLAKTVMLRHNIQAYVLKGDDAQVAKLGTELAEIEAVVQREEKERTNQDRLERLIAATERLAAAIENNGGQAPDDAGEMVAEIVPFERDRDGGRDLVYHVYQEIATCRLPIIALPRIHHRHGPKAVHRRTGTSIGTGVHGSTNIYPSTKRGVTRSSTRSTFGTSRQPQVRSVPAPRQPQVRQAR